MMTVDDIMAMIVPSLIFLLRATAAKVRAEQGLVYARCLLPNMRHQPTNWHDMPDFVDTNTAIYMQPKM